MNTLNMNKQVEYRPHFTDWIAPVSITICINRSIIIFNVSFFYFLLLIG